MPNLKALKQRINSVRSTKKITSAMKMVATSNYKRFQGRLEGMRYFVENTHRNVGKLFQDIHVNDPIPPLLKGDPGLKKTLIFVVGTDKGLCGNFNMVVFHRALQHVHQRQKEGQNVDVICLGKKLKPFFNLVSDVNVIEVAEVNYKDFSTFANRLTYAIQNYIAEKTYGMVDLVYTQFESALKSSIAIDPLVPFTQQKHQSSTVLFGVEPSPPILLAELCRLNIQSQLAHGCLESKTSEESARMMAMDNATRNADDMIQKLQVVYNRTRQAYITKELIEIISGAEAL